MNKLSLQSTCFENIKTLCTNYNKDSKTRKTKEYLNKRLSSLEDQWMDFNARHTLLLQEIEDKNINYFVEDVYGKTKTMYETTKADISKMLQTTEENVKFDLTDLSRGEPDEKTKTLLTKQECNFKAIDRAMAKIDYEVLAEKWELDDHLSILKSKWEAIDNTHWELEALLKGSKHTYYDKFNSMEAKYDEIRKQLKSKMWSTAHHQHSAPRIEIPEFSGHYSKWISFKDLFLETIHKNPTLNKAQKMQHLKTRLKGEAERLVQHLSISADNYSSCWDILNQRYNNRRLQFSSYMNTMLQLPVIQKPDAYNLKKLHDVTTECLNGLTNIGFDITSWDPMIVHLMSQKLDCVTYNEYIKNLHNNRDVPTLQEFLMYLENQFMAFETMKTSKKDIQISEKSAGTEKHIPRKNFDNKKWIPKTYHTSYGQCPLCKNNHVLMRCQQFIDSDTKQRNSTVAKLRLCKNCLFSHENQTCNSTKTCKECNMKHHTLLHYNNSNKNIPSTSNENHRSGQRPSREPETPSSNHLSASEMEVLLTTVQVKVKSIDGTYVTLRALVDQGSQVNLITENAAQILKLPRNKLTAKISGVGTVSGDCKGRLNLTCKSIHSEYTFNTEALIMKKLINKLPNNTFERPDWSHLQNLKLADPDFNISRSVDILLGADVYAEIIQDGILKGAPKSPVAQQTQLGWILCGKLETFNCHVTLLDLAEITKFWECEDVTKTNTDRSQEDQCETYYKETTRRGSDGRYIVKMPLFPNYENKIGTSKTIAVSQLLQLEKRFKKNGRLEMLYKEFLREYLELGHMKPAKPMTSLTTECFLPHHGVLREEFTTMLAKIEACMNSRPLCQLTEDPEEFYNYLTPGHFLTGGPTMSLPRADYTDENYINLRRRWQLTEHMYQQFWKNWSSDYLTQLQTRSKWNNPKKNLSEGDIVLVRDDNLPPGKWAMGRVLKLHPGADGYVRVITLKTQTGVIKRPIVKLSALPIDTNCNKNYEERKTHLQKSSKTTTTKHSGTKCLTNILLSLFTMLILVNGSYGSQQSSGTQITNLEPERPIYYDTIGKIELIHDEWTLLTYYNLTNYWQGVQHIDEYINGVNDLCQKIHQSYCQATTDQLSHEMELLNYYNTLLLAPHKHLSMRKKRGLIDGVGMVASSLFGVLDQKFADKYHKDIDAIQRNENYLRELAKNQTSIMQLQNDVLKKNDENIKLQCKMIEHFMEETKTNLGSIETEIQIMMATSYFNSASLTASLLLRNLKEIQTMLLNTLTNVYSGHMDVHLISPVSLVKTLEDISGRLPRTLSLPTENIREDIKELYKLLYVKARITKNYFMFEVHIPLISNEDFTYYRAIAIPFKAESNYKLMQLSSEYIAVNFEKNSYISLKDKDFKQCIKRQKDNFICNANIPVFNLQNKNAPCEAKLLGHRTITSPCDVHSVSCEEAWIKLQEPNSWLVVCCGRCELRTVCENDVISQTITSAAIVTLNQGCVLRSKELTITSHNQYNSNLNVNYDMHVPNLNSPINNIVNVTLHNAPHELFTLKKNDFEEIDKKLRFQQENEPKLPSTITDHDVHQYAICYLLLTIAVITFLWIITRKYCTVLRNRFPRKTNRKQTHEDIELQPMGSRQQTAREENQQAPTDECHGQLQGHRDNIAFTFD